MADREAATEAIRSVLRSEGPMTTEEIAATVAEDHGVDETIAKAVLANLILSPELESVPDREDAYRIVEDRD